MNNEVEKQKYDILYTKDTNERKKSSTNSGRITGHGGKIYDLFDSEK